MLAIEQRPWITDFATIFSHMWYRDFPRQKDAHRSDWTTHIGLTVRATADLMGLFTHFESGGRTDAVLKNNENSPLAALEWEHRGFHEGDSIVNEFAKLQKWCTENPSASFACLLGYAIQGGRLRHNIEQAQRARDLLEGYTGRWKAVPPLLLVVIEYESDVRRRIFSQITMDKLVGGERRRLRQQPAYPWRVIGSRWADEQKAE